MAAQDRGHQRSADRVRDELLAEIHIELEELRHEVAGLTATLATVNTSLLALGGTQRKIVDQLRSVRPGLDEVIALAPLVRRHETDIATRLAHRTAERQDIGTERLREQQVVWKRFDVFIGRPMMQAVNALLHRGAGPHHRGAKAELVARVIRLFFPPGGDGAPNAVDAAELGRAIGEDRLDDLLREARQIRQDAEALGLEAYWGPVEEHPDWFVDWPSSGPEGTAFVVVPAWAAESRRVGPGKVFRL